MTYRAAYLTDGQHETVLTWPEHAELTDDALLRKARAEMLRAGIPQGDLDLVVGDWTDTSEPAPVEPRRSRA